MRRGTLTRASKAVSPLSGENYWICNGGRAGRSVANSRTHLKPKSWFWHLLRTKWIHIIRRGYPFRAHDCMKNLQFVWGEKVRER